MPVLYEVYDSDEVLLVTKRRFNRIMLTLGVAGILAIAMVFYLTARPKPMLIWSAVLVLTSGAILHVLVSRLQALRRVVWCVKVSDRLVSGYNYARRRTRIDWTDVDYVDLERRSLRLVSESGTSIEVLYRFQEFVDLGHRLVEYAEFYELPVLIDGRPIDEVDLDGVYPYAK
ncbi:MAG: hypothetical protein AAF752_05365 [Bacteroidota bacterium]